MRVTHLRDENGVCDPGCFGCKLESVKFAPSAMPTRNPGAARAAVTDPQLAKDRDAYKRLRRNGEQPRHLQGSAELEATANTSAEITTGLLMNDYGRDLLNTKAKRRQFSESFSEQPSGVRTRTSPDEPSVLA